jgi:mono/diheme cytochrome c family protein
VTSVRARDVMEVLATAVLAAAVLALSATVAFGQEAAALATEGKRLFGEQGCYGCHTIGKTGTPIATELTRVGSKYPESYLRGWLREPQKQKPGAHMPKIQMSEPDARALAAYLASLK